MFASNSTPQQSKGTQLPLISSKIEGKKEYCYCVVQRIEVKKAAMAAALDLSFLRVDSLFAAGFFKNQGRGEGKTSSNM